MLLETSYLMRNHVASLLIQAGFRRNLCKIFQSVIIMVAKYTTFPSIIFFQFKMNGRFETHKKICLSISGHHPETWQPSWSIRTALVAIIGYMPSRALGTIASLDYSPEERRSLAKR